MTCKDDLVTVMSSQLLSRTKPVCHRLLSWAGKRIDPVAVDYILQKLGFQHARLTIPKWMQRGCMDPLDKILSMLIDRLLTSLEEDRPQDSPD